ncbi:MAG: MFS transporter [Actinomycetales bacterium]
MTTATLSRRPPQPLDLRRAEEPAPPLSALGLATTLLGTLLAMIDFFIVNVALPTIAGDLRASAATLELVVSGYATAYAVLLVVGGRLGDTYGRRRLFVIGMAAFTLTSLLCGIAPSGATLVLARILQGAAAALLVPQTLSTIQATGTAASRARAIGWFGASGGIAAVVGQVLGGVLVAANVFGSSWRPIFLVNVPLGLVGLWLARRHLPETRSLAPSRPDLLGTVLLAAAVISLLVPLTEGRALGWPVWSLLLLATVPVWAIAFVATEHLLERRGATPLLPPSILEHRSMRWGLSLAAPFFAGFGAFMFVYALLVQDVLGWSPAKAGLGLTPMAVAFLIASLTTSRAVARWGRTVITVGAAVQLVGLVTFGLTVWATWPAVDVLTLAPGLALAGFGQGWIMPPLIRVVLSDVPASAAGVGSGTITTTQQVALAIGVAAVGSLFLSMSASGGPGPVPALLTVLAIQSVVALGLVVGSRGLPARS